MLALLAFGTAEGAEYIQAGRHPELATINEIGDRFKAIFHEHGMRGVSQAINDCYDRLFSSAEGIAACALWDVAALRLDNIMRKLFVARGTPDPGPATTFMSPAAFSARMQTYGRLAFGPNPDAVNRYLGDAPNRVLHRVVPAD